MYFITFPCPNYFHFDFDVLRKDMFSLYICVEKPRFLSLGGISGGEIERRTMLGLWSKLKNIQHILSTQRCGHLLAQTMMSYEWNNMS